MILLETSALYKLFTHLLTYLVHSDILFGRASILICLSEVGGLTI